MIRVQGESGSCYALDDQASALSGMTVEARFFRGLSKILRFDNLSSTMSGRYRPDPHGITTIRQRKQVESGPAVSSFSVAGELRLLQNAANRHRHIVYS